MQAADLYPGDVVVAEFSKYPQIVTYKKGTVLGLGRTAMRQPTRRDRRRLMPVVDFGASEFVLLHRPDAPRVRRYGRAGSVLRLIED